MRKQNLPIKRLATEEALTQVAVDELKYPDLEALYVARGRGARLAAVGRGAPRRGSLSGTPEEDVTEVPLARPVRIGHAGRGRPGRRWCAGCPDVWVRLGRCCTPVPGDEIMGFVTRGQGVSRAPHRLPEREVAANGSPSG